MTEKAGVRESSNRKENLENRQMDGFIRKVNLCSFSYTVFGRNYKREMEWKLIGNPFNSGKHWM